MDIVCVFSLLLRRRVVAYNNKDIAIYFGLQIGFTLGQRQRPVWKLVVKSRYYNFVNFSEFIL